MPLHPHLGLIHDHRALLAFAGTASYFRDQIGKLRCPGGDRALAVAVQEALDGLDDLLGRTLERAQADIEERIEAAEAVDTRLQRLGELRAEAAELSLQRQALDSRYGVRDRNYYDDLRGIEHAEYRVGDEWRRIERELQAEQVAAATRQPIAAE